MTAGNAPGLNDGASAAGGDVARLRQGRTASRRWRRVTGYATGGGEPKDLFFAPILAVRNLMARTGTEIGDYDLIEANEAFAVQAIADGTRARAGTGTGSTSTAARWPWAIPIGASGARVLTTLLYAMEDRGASTGSRDPLSRRRKCRGPQRGA